MPIITDLASTDDGATSRTTINTNFDNLNDAFVNNETPVGTIDGVNKTFTLPSTPSPAASLLLFLNGAFQTAVGEDYTLSTATITFVNAPPTGSVLRAFYRK